jgi:hypothetical protein
MEHLPDYDPTRKSWEGDRFNVLWLKHGEQMTLIQRIGFAVISFAMFSFGLFVETIAIHSLFEGELLSVGTLGSVFAIVTGLFILVFGTLGLRNVCDLSK